jgi:hypothetical protein
VNQDPNRDLCQQLPLRDTRSHILSHVNDHQAYENVRRIEYDTEAWSSWPKIVHFSSLTSRMAKELQARKAQEV